MSSVTQLPLDEFNRRYNLIQEDVKIRATNGTLYEHDCISPELHQFVEKMKTGSVALLSRYAQAKDLPIFNYFCYEIFGSK